MNIWVCLWMWFPCVCVSIFKGFSFFRQLLNLFPSTWNFKWFKNFIEAVSAYCFLSFSFINSVELKFHIFWRLIFTLNLFSLSDLEHVTLLESCKPHWFSLFGLISKGCLMPVPFESWAWRRQPKREPANLGFPSFATLLCYFWSFFYHSSSLDLTFRSGWNKTFSQSQKGSDTCSLLCTLHFMY